MTEMLYWEDGDRYFDDVDAALEYFFDELEQEIPDTLQPCKPVECTEKLAERLAAEVIDYIGDNVPEMSCEEYNFTEFLSAANKQKLISFLQGWVTEAASVVEADYKAQPVPFKADAIAYRSSE